MTDSTAPEQIIINGQAYSPEDATQLVELGNKWKKTESELNTSLDKVYPEYTKASQRAAQLEKELAEARAEAERYKQEQAQKAKAETPDTIQQARKAAREIGLADEDYLKEKGYMTRDEAEQFFADKQSQQEQVKTVLNNAATLEKEIDGSDGRVPFDQRAVLAYAASYGIDDLRQAYDQMNEKGNLKWKEEQIAREEKPGLTTLTPNGKKEPQRIRVTDDNLGAMLGEMLDGIKE